MKELRTRRPQLLVRMGTRSLRVRLEEGVTSIGSDPACSLALSADGVAPRHCILQRGEDGAFEVFDLLSPGGTRLNGAPAQAASLSHGDHIQVGEAHLTFLLDTEPEAPPAPGDAEIPVPPLAEDPWEAWRDQPAFALPPRNDPEATLDEPAPEPPRKRGLLPWLEAWRESLAARSLERQALRDERRRERESEERRLRIEALRAEAARAEATAMEVRRRFDEAKRFQAPPPFHEQVVHQLRSTPFLAISLAVHVLIAIILNLSSIPQELRRTVPPVTASLEDRQPFDDEFAEDERVEEPRPAEPVEEPIPEPFEHSLPPEAPAEPRESDWEEPHDDPSRDEFPAFGGAIGILDGSLGLRAGRDAGLRIGGEDFRRTVRYLRKQGLDVVVVIDSTGSMGGVIDQARREVDQLVTALGTLIPGFRLGVVTYRDHNEEYVVRSTPLTNDWYRAVAFLDTVRAAGGGDFPEAVLDGIRQAVRHMSWSPGSQRVVVLVGDAPPHDKDRKPLQDILRTFSRSGGKVHTLLAATAGRRTAASLRATFEELATLGAGTCFALDEGTALARMILTLAFGQQHRDDVSEALASLESGPAWQVAARTANSGSPGEILQRLRKGAPDYLLLRELLRSDRHRNLPVYLDALGDAEVPLATRWALTVAVRRLLSRPGSPPALTRLGEAVDPEGRAEAQRRLLFQIRESWERTQPPGGAPR